MWEKKLDIKNKYFDFFCLSAKIRKIMARWNLNALMSKVIKEEKKTINTFEREPIFRR